MQTNDLINAINEISQERELDRNLVIATIEEAILLAARKKYVEYENLEVSLNQEIGEFELTVLKEVVEEIENSNNEVSLQEAQEIDSETELGDFVEHRIEPKDFSNIIAQTTRMMLFQKIKEIEREHISQKYTGFVKTIVHGKVGRIDRRRITVLLNDNSEAVLDYREQIPFEKFQPGENIRCLLLEVKNETKGPQLHLSRRHPDFLRELFDQEIPEVYEKLIEIIAVARDPGRRAKVAVRSNDPDVDPIGACVGPKGSRIQPIVSELNGERIDIIEYSENITGFIREALSPGKVVSMTIDEEERIVDVEVDPETLSAAIGRQGQNVKLASILTRYTINVMATNTDEQEEIFPESEETEELKTEEVSPAIAQSEIIGEEPFVPAPDESKPIDEAIISKDPVPISKNQSAEETMTDQESVRTKEETSAEVNSSVVESVDNQNLQETAVKEDSSKKESLKPSS